MTVYLVDFENVRSGGLKGVEELSEGDKVVIFYSKNADAITFDVHMLLSKSKAEIETFRILRGGRNSLDFQLSTYLGYLVMENCYKNIVIISQDKGFLCATSFWEENQELCNCNIRLCKSIATSDKESSTSDEFDDGLTGKFIEKVDMRKAPFMQNIQNNESTDNSVTNNDGQIENEHHGLVKQPSNSRNSEEESKSYERRSDRMNDRGYGRRYPEAKQIVKDNQSVPGRFVEYKTGDYRSYGNYSKNSYNFNRPKFAGNSNNSNSASNSYNTYNSYNSNRMNYSGNRNSSYNQGRPRYNGNYNNSYGMNRPRYNDNYNNSYNMNKANYTDKFNTPYNENKANYTGKYNTSYNENKANYTDKFNTSYDDNKQKFIRNSDTTYDEDKQKFTRNSDTLYDENKQKVTSNIEASDNSKTQVITDAVNNQDNPNVADNTSLLQTNERIENVNNSETKAVEDKTTEKKNLNVQNPTSKNKIFAAEVKLNITDDIKNIVGDKYGEDVVPVLVETIGKSTGKQHFYRMIVSKLGQEKGHELYMMIKGQYANLKRK